MLPRFPSLLMVGSLMAGTGLVTAQPAKGQGMSDWCGLARLHLELEAHHVPQWQKEKEALLVRLRKVDLLRVRQLQHGFKMKTEPFSLKEFYGWADKAWLLTEDIMKVEEAREVVADCVREELAAQGIPLEEPPLETGGVDEAYRTPMQRFSQQECDGARGYALANAGKRAAWKNSHDLLAGLDEAQAVAAQCGRQ
jgi:hypothetical protein